MRDRPGQWEGPEPLWRLVVPLLSVLVRLVLRVDVCGLDRVPRRGPVVLAVNHTSRLDPVVLVTALHPHRRPRFLAVSGLFERRFVGWFLRRGRMIPVVRGGGVERMVEDAGVALEAGQVVVVYPEGTIAPPGATLAARPGAGLLALRTAAPVLPVAIEGLRDREGRRVPWLPRPRQHVTVHVGSPVDLGRLRRGRIDRQAQFEAGATVLAAVRRLLAAQRRATRRQVA